MSIDWGTKASLQIASLAACTTPEACDRFFEEHPLYSVHSYVGGHPLLMRILYDTTEDSDMVILQYFMDHGADINNPSTQPHSIGWTILMDTMQRWALAQSRLERIIRFICFQWHADVDLVSNNGRADGISNRGHKAADVRPLFYGNANSETHDRMAALNKWHADVDFVSNNERADETSNHRRRAADLQPVYYGYGDSEFHDRMAALIRDVPRIRRNVCIAWLVLSADVLRRKLPEPVKQRVIELLM